MNNNRDDEAKSGKKYKKQLQKQLFEGQRSPSVARVKCEPSSDPDPDPDDSYLALRVKLERAAATHDTTTPSDSSVTHSSRKSKKKKRKRERDDPSDECDDKTTSSRIEDELDSATSTPRKKKLKVGRGSGDAESYEMNGMIIEDKFSAEETVVEARPSSKGRRRPPMSNGNETDGTNRSAERKSKVKPDGVFTSKEFISDESGDDDDAQESRKSKTALASHPARRSSTRDGEPPADRAADAHSLNISHRTSKVSDRIRFEEDTATDGMDVDTSEIPGESGVRSTKLRRYLSSRAHLRAAAPRPRPRAARLTRDDEVWLLTCPHELDVSALRGTGISLDEDAKCKIKVDGQTYNGSVDDHDARINILSVESDRTVIVNLPVSGTVRFRKRIPKAHFVEDGNVRNDRTDFIPLPETKCRHPLFGPDYRRAVRIPTSVKDRLNRLDVEEPPTRKKKKHKKERVDADAPPEPEPELEQAVEPRRSKKRKHKHTDTEEPTVKKKRVKQEPSSAAAWDSEKAIEENLFNF